jgi:hypothetical protein
MWKRVESAVVRRQLVLWPARLALRSGSLRFEVDLNAAEPESPNALAQGSVRRLKFADRTFRAKSRERIADRSGGSPDTANAATSVR